MIRKMKNFFFIGFKFSTGEEKGARGDWLGVRRVLYFDQDAILAMASVFFGFDFFLVFFEGGLGLGDL